jgi:hypothetical protein
MTPGGTGFPPGYSAPPSAYTPPATPDPNAFLLQPRFVEPYWVGALANDDYMRNGGASPAIVNGIAFSFPDLPPDYYSGAELEGWAPASAAVRAAFLQVFSELGAILDISFVEVADVAAFNVIAISQNDQPGLAGYAFFPNTSFLIGSDILLSNDNDRPVTDGSLTNFDYELVLHELGHALGLKHPFEADGRAITVLSSTEDTSFWTVMTYTQRPAAYDGSFRDLDLMILADMFGVNPGYRAGNDIYTFSPAGGVFIVDGNGSDTIMAAGRGEDAYIDLRPGMHSYLGSKSAFITAPFQLTISGGSAIEVAIGGSGADHLVGNNVDNLLIGGAANDRLFGGEGADRLRWCEGDDLIDLSEMTAARDIVVFEAMPSTNGRDTIYAFAQGPGGDVIGFAPMAGAALLPVVTALTVPSADLAGVILRLAHADINTPQALLATLVPGGLFSNLRLSSGAEILVISSASQATGLDQDIFLVGNNGADLFAHHMATFVGNRLDIDEWHSFNFV